jgi:hypothetical protein
MSSAIPGVHCNTWGTSLMDQALGRADNRAMANTSESMRRFQCFDVAVVQDFREQICASVDFVGSHLVAVRVRREVVRHER